MAKKAISTPSVTINGDVFSVKPNSVKITKGAGTTKVRWTSTGGGGGSTVHSEDAEGRVGKVKFSLEVTAGNLAKFDLLKLNTGGNTVVLAQKGETAITFTGMSLENDPEWNLGADGGCEFEFGGEPAV